MKILLYIIMSWILSGILFTTVSLKYKKFFINSDNWEGSFISFKEFVFISFTFSIYLWIFLIYDYRNFYYYLKYGNNDFIPIDW